MAQKSFTAQVDDWVRASTRRAEAVMKQSAQDVVDEAQKPRAKGGRMRVDTGFLRSSGRSSLHAPITTLRAKPDAGRFTFNEGQVSLTLAKMELGDDFYFTYGANYARPREYGARGQAPDAFVRSAAAKWQTFVTRNAQAARQRAVR